jgi:hypothetical protein
MFMSAHTGTRRKLAGRGVPRGHARTPALREVDHKPEIKVWKSSRCLHASARRDNFSVPAIVLHASVINHYYDYALFVADEDV